MDFAAFWPWITRQTRMALMRAAFALLFAALIPSSHAAAQSFSYQPLPVGDRAVGMGGAFTGVAEDLSAAWYNPGGLAFQDNAGVSGAIFIRLYDRYRIENGYGFGGDTSDLASEGSLSTPFFIGGYSKIGPEDDPADRRHAIAFTGLGPPVPTLRFRGFSTPDDSLGGGVDIISDQSQQYYGPSYSYRVSDTVGVGVSGYLSIASVDYSEAEFKGRYGLRSPDGTYAGSSLGARISGGSAEVFSLLFRFGVLWKVRDDLNVGLTMQLPNVPLIRNGEVYEGGASVDESGTGRYQAADYDTKAAIPQPFELRLGIAYQPRQNWRLAFDFSFYAPIGSEANPVRIFGEAPIDPTLGRPPSAGRFIADGIYAQPSFNVSVGMETVIADVVPVSLGFYTDLSPTKELNRTSAAQAAAHVDTFGLTAVVGIRSGGYNAAIGTAVVFGGGAALAPNPDGSGGFVSRNVDEQAVYIFFTGYTQAAEQLAEDFEDLRRTDEEREDHEEERARLERLRLECEERLEDEHREAEGEGREADPVRIIDDAGSPQTTDDADPLQTTDDAESADDDLVQDTPIED